ncbi:MAG: transketolase [Patescibacteria group bacterium]|nr:MAG: transketolase [Patescibacteria group bacterium]
MLSYQELSDRAREIRILVLKSIFNAGSGHPAGSLGTADIFAAFYFGILKHDPKNPEWEDRDRFILSNGHICPAQYAALALSGYFLTSKLNNLRKIGSGLQGHPHKGRLPGVETTSGPLGSGLAQAVGISLAARLDGKELRIYCLTSDGEHDSGNHWEAVAVASKYKLNNLTVIVDRNKIQLSGDTEDIMPLEPLTDKYKAFGFNVLEIDGHDFGQIFEAVEKARNFKDGPTVIIAQTIPGKGVSFMEGKWQWHGKAPNEKEFEEAVKELEGVI